MTCEQQLVYTGDFDRKTQFSLQELRRTGGGGTSIFLGQTDSGARDVQALLLRRSPLIFERRASSPIVWAVKPHDDFISDHPAMIESAGNDGVIHHIVANGLHIENLATELAPKITEEDIIPGKTLSSALVEEEPFDDNTPKITAITTRVGSLILNRFSQIYNGRDGFKKRTVEGSTSQRPGFGEIVHAIKGNRTDLSHQPVFIPLEGETAMQIAEYFWQRTLPSDVLTAVAVKTIERRTGEVKFAGASWHDRQVRPL